MSEITTELYAVNINTGRLLKKSTAKYKKLAKLGQVREILPNEIEKPQPKPKEPPKPEEKTEEKQFNEKDYKAMLKSELENIVAEHKDKFEKELTQDKTNALLKQLLYEKLVKEKKPDKPDKKKKKSKFKIKKIQLSSSDSSESDE